MVPIVLGWIVCMVVFERRKRPMTERIEDGLLLAFMAVIVTWLMGDM